MHKKQLLILFTSSILFGCTSGTERADLDGDRQFSRGSDCISEGTIRNYEVLDDSNLVITASASRKYHVVLMRRAMNLRSSWNIGFASATSRICGGFSELLVNDAFGAERIRLRSVQRLTPEQYEDLQYLYQTGDAKQKEPPPQQEVEGAQVEELD